MLLHLTPGRRLGDCVKRRATLFLLRSKDWNLSAIPRRPVERILACIIRIGGGISEDDQRRLQALGTVDRHHPHGIGGRRGIPRDLDFTTIEPVEETLQRRGGILFEAKRGVQQLLDRIARFLAQPLE